MIIDTEKIKDLLASEMTGYRVAQLTNVKQPMYDRYKNGETPIENMTLKVASQLMRVIEIEEKNIDENVMHDQFVYDFIDMIWEEMTEENVAIYQMEAYLEENGDSGIRQLGTVYVDEDNILLTIPMSSFEESYCMYRNENGDLIRDESMNKYFKMDMLSNVKKRLKEKGIEVK
ncbi:MAG: hypothetical protein L0J33_05805 [Tetragenococcus halophilus]|nr:hypothetical protein [Tetragenococcus halophilus]